MSDLEGSRDLDEMLAALPDSFRAGSGSAISRGSLTRRPRRAWAARSARSAAGWLAVGPCFADGWRPRRRPGRRSPLRVRLKPTALLRFFLLPCSI